MYFMQKGITIFRWKFFVSQFRKISLRKPSVSQKISGIEKLYAQEGNITIVYKKYCCLTVPKILRRGTLLCFRKVLVSKKLMDKRGEGRREYHDSPSKNVCLTVPKKFVGETFSVSLISGTERFYASEIYLTILCRNFFCLSAQKFRRGTFLICVSEKIWYRKKLWIRGGGGKEEGVSRFSVENFWSHSGKIFRGHPFNVSENLGYRKILCITGGITFFRRIMMVSQCRKISRSSLQNFRKLGVSKNFMHNSITIFRRKYFASRCRKIS